MGFCGYFILCDPHLWLSFGSLVIHGVSGSNFCSQPEDQAKACCNVNLTTDLSRHKIIQQLISFRTVCSFQCIQRPHRVASGVEIGSDWPYSICEGLGLDWIGPTFPIRLYTSIWRGVERTSPSHLMSQSACSSRVSFPDPVLTAHRCLNRRWL